MVVVSSGFWIMEMDSIAFKSYTVVELKFSTRCKASFLETGEKVWLFGKPHLMRIGALEGSHIKASQKVFA